MSNPLRAIRYKGEKFLELTWQVTGNCNYRCSYCHPRNHSQPRRQLAAKDFDFLEELFEIYKSEGYDLFKIFLTGGEPTYWTSLLPFCEFAYNQLPKLRMGINTNLSAPLSWWQKHYHHFDEVVASYHIEEANKEKFIDKIVFLQKHVHHVHTRLMMKEDQVPELLNIAKEIKDRCENYYIEYAPILNELHPNTIPWKYHNKKYEDLIKNLGIESQFNNFIPARTPFKGVGAVYENGEQRRFDAGEIIARRENFFKGWHCQIDHSLFIAEDGRMAAGTCGVLKDLGNFYKGEFTKHSGGVVCPRGHCHCGADIAIPKYKLSPSTSQGRLKLFKKLSISGSKSSGQLR